MASDRTKRGWASAVLGCTLVLAGALGGAWVERRRLAGFALTDPGALAWNVIARREHAWAEAARRREALPAVLFGDSVVIQPNGGPLLGPALRDALADGGIRAEILDAAHVGFSAFQYYYVLGRVLAAHPRLAVVEVNVRTFADDWTRTQFLRFPRLAAGLSFAQSWRARDALVTQDLGPLDLVVFRLEEATDTLFVADGVRVLGQRALQTTGARVNDLLGLPTAPVGEKFARFLPPALDADTARAWYGHDFVHHPAVAVLRQLLEELRAAGVRTLMFVAPVNTDRITSLHLTVEIGLDERLAELQRAIGANRDEWLDAHALFRNPEFRDALHVKPSAVAELGARIAQRLRDRLDVEEARSADARTAK